MDAARVHATFNDISRFSDVHDHQLRTFFGYEAAMAEARRRGDPPPPPPPAQALGQAENLAR